MIVAFRASPHRWTLLLPSGAPVRGQAAPSTGYVWMLKGSFRAGQRQGSRPQCGHLAGRQLSPRCPTGGRCCFRPERPSGGGWRGPAVSLAFTRCPFSPCIASKSARFLLRQLRRHSAGQVLWWCGCKLPGLAFTVTSARWAKHEVFALRGAALAAAAGRTRRRSETASIPTPALGCQQLRRPKSEKSTKRRVDDAGECSKISLRTQNESGGRMTVPR